MIALDTTTRTLEVVLASAKTSVDCPWISSYEDVPNYRPTTVPPANPILSENGTTNGATAVTIMSASGTAGTFSTRQLRSFNLSNQDTATITVSIQLNDNGTRRKVIGPYNLDPSETLIFEDMVGWATMAADGSRKSTPDTPTSTAASKAQSAALVNSTAASKEASVSLNVSALTSTAAAPSLNTSAALSTAVQASTASSVADSKAVSDSTTESTNLSTLTSKDTSQSTILSQLTSRITSAGW